MFAVPDRLWGKPVRCSRCKTTFTLPRRPQSSGAPLPSSVPTELATAPRKVGGDHGNAGGAMAGRAWAVIAGVLVCALVVLLVVAAVQHRSVTTTRPRSSPSLTDPTLDQKITNSIGMKLVLIPKGKFMMGSPDGEKDRSDEEGPRHEVEISRAFYMGVYPVTQAEYATVIGKNPSRFSRTGLASSSVAGLDTGRFPVDDLSWHDVVAFCEALTRRDTKKPAGWMYGLPTEAEWEYACRAGTQTAYSFGDDPERLV
jgi:formylglycine-generating enzyme required for sulfatase activity